MLRNQVCRPEAASPAVTVRMRPNLEAWLVYAAGPACFMFSLLSSAILAPVSAEQFIIPCFVPHTSGVLATCTGFQSVVRVVASFSLCGSALPLPVASEA